MTKDTVSILRRRNTDKIWAQAAIDEREDDKDDSAGSKSSVKEERFVNFPKYDAGKVTEILKNAAGQDAKDSLQMHTPQCKYTATDAGRVIMIPPVKEGLEARLAYIVSVDLKNDMGRIYVLTQKKSKLEKETCWFYKK